MNADGKYEKTFHEELVIRLLLKPSEGKSAVGNSNENYLIGNYFPFNRPKRKGIKEVKKKERMKKIQKG